MITKILNRKEINEKKKLSLSAKVFIGFGIGIILGIVFKEKILFLKPVGDILLRLIKMLVVPMIFFSITAGVCSIGDMQKLNELKVEAVQLNIKDYE